MFIRTLPAKLLEVGSADLSLDTWKLAACYKPFKTMYNKWKKHSRVKESLKCFVIIVMKKATGTLHLDNESFIKVVARFKNIKALLQWARPLVDFTTG